MFRSIRLSTAQVISLIPIHALAQKLGKDICNAISKIHLLAGCDANRKVVIKVAALKANYHY